MQYILVRHTYRKSTITHSYSPLVAEHMHIRTHTYYSPFIVINSYKLPCICSRNEIAEVAGHMSTYITIHRHLKFA
jgi:hypothetical protein